MELGYICDVAYPNDVDAWIRLVDVVKDNFPGLVMEDYRETLLKNIDRQSAVCVKYQNEIVGVLFYSIKQKTLSCMAVHPAHRRKGIATALIKKMIDNTPKGSEIWVTTFREDDPKGIEPRALYKRTGFIEDELSIEFDYPVQKFVLHI